MYMRHQIPLIVFDFFFFQSSVDHRDLHSFPTRRSSDLNASKSKRYFVRWLYTDRQVHFRSRNEAWQARAIEWWSKEICFPDRKSTRLNSSHVEISYAVFCLKKKKRRLLQNTYSR